MTLIKHASAAILVAVVLVACGGNDPAALRQSAEKAMANGNYQAAIVDLKNILKQQPDDAEVRLMLGRAALASGDVGTAASQARKAMDRGMPGQRGQPLLGRALIGQADYEAVLESLDPAVAEDASIRAELLAFRGSASLALGRAGDAESAFAKALEADPESLEAMLGAARLAQARDESARVDELIERARAVAPEHPRVALVQGNRELAAGRLQAAREHYQRAIGGDGSRILPRERFEARSQLVTAYLRDERFDEAGKVVSTMLEQSPRHPTPNYLAGMIDYRNGELDKAASRLQSVLNQAPNSMRAKLLLGAVKLEQGQLAQARDHLSAVVSNRPQELRARLLYARALRESGDEEQATSVLADGMALADDSPQSLSVLGRALSQTGDLEGMKGALERYPEAEAQALETNLGEALLGAGRTDEAMALLSEGGQDGRADDLRRRRLRLVALVRNGDTEKALGETGEMVKAYPDDVTARLFAGNVYSALDKPEQARSEFQAVKRIAPDRAVGDLFLGRLALSRDDYESAGKSFERALEIDPDNAEVMISRARLAYEQGEPQQAFDWLQKARKADPDAETPRLMLARGYLSAGRASEAREVAQELVDIAPEQSRAYAVRGVAELADGAAEQAVDTLRRALELAPSDARVRFALARAQLVAGRNEAAVTNLQALREGYPEAPRVAYLMAMARERTGDVDAALKLAEEIETATDDSGAGLNLKGQILARAERPGEAVEALRQAAERGQRQAVPALMQLGMDHDVEVAPALESWLEANPDDQNLRFRVAGWYIERGNHAKALPHLEALAETDNPAVLNNLAIVYQELGDERALETARRAHELAPDSPSVLDTVGWLETLAGNLDAGVTLLARAVDGAPENGEIRYHYAEALARVGDRSGAREQVQRALDASGQFPARDKAESLHEQLTASDG